MHFKLKDQNGNIITPILNENHKPVVRLNDIEYEILELASYDNDHNFMYSHIADFDADPEVQKMIEESEHAIKAGQVYSTSQVIEMIKNGDI